MPALSATVKLAVHAWALTQMRRYACRSKAGEHCWLSVMYTDVDGRWIGFILPVNWGALAGICSAPMKRHSAGRHVLPAA